MYTRIRTLSTPLLLASLALTTGIAATAHAEAAEGYLRDSSGDFVRSNSGNCWHTSQWQPGGAIEQCAPWLVAKAAPEPAETGRTTRRIALQSDAYFAFDSAELTEEGRSKLDEIAQTLPRTEDARIQITGYTDPIGTDEYNLDLSQRRAEAVKDYLTARGVPALAIETHAKGASNFVEYCPGMQGDELIRCLAPNRRTEVEFSAVEVVEEPAGSVPRTQ